MANDFGIPTRNLNYSEMLMVLSEQQKAARLQLDEHKTMLHRMLDQLTDAQQQHALGDQSIAHLRDQTTRAMLTASKALDAADAVGRKLDHLRDIVEQERVTQRSRYHLIGWGVAAVICLFVILLITAHLRGWTLGML